MSISKSKLKKLKKAGKLRDNIEIWVDKHNHKMELVRTLTSMVGIILSCIIMLKVFKII
jgi:ABC-type lipoprotein release transport system permease subunit